MSPHFVPAACQQPAQLTFTANSIPVLLARRARHLQAVPSS